jgi:predicted dehydrogenase
MKSLKGALIGCGAIAREHLAALAGLKKVEVVAVCDISAAKAEAAAERFGVPKWYSDYKQLITELRPDLVHITTPPSSHFPIAKSCLSAGLNTLCEKPITVDYQEFVELKQLAIQNHCVLMENHSVLFQSSVQRIQALIASGQLGDVLEVQIALALSLFGAGSPYVDESVPHFSLILRGGVIGDFLTHIACLVDLFTGPVISLRTIWAKRVANSPLPADEFRSLIKGERATAFVEFSGNAQPNGFWVRVVGTKMYAEANLFEPPRLTRRRFRSGEPALATVIDGTGEARDVLRGTLQGFWRKLAGTNRYDGFPEFLTRTYQCIEMDEPQPIPLDKIDEISRLVDNFTNPELKL